MNRILGLGASVLLMTSLCFPQASEIARRLGLQTGLSDSKISSGLKQALQIGAEQAVKVTGRPNGYFGNPEIKILMPSNLRHDYSLDTNVPNWHFVVAVTGSRNSEGLAESRKRFVAPHFGQTISPV